MLAEYWESRQLAKGTKKTLCADMKRCPEDGVVQGKPHTVEQNAWEGPT